MNEGDRMRAIAVAIGQNKTRVFRNNVGTARAYNEPKRIIKFGLCNGSSDLIGYHQLEITPDMVGKTVAVFTAIEVKSPGGRVSKDQKNFIEHLRSAGGIAGVCSNPTEAKELIIHHIDQLNK